MVRVACLAAAIVVAAVTDSIIASAGVLEDARAQAWFWPSPVADWKQEARGPEWFWSFRPTEAIEKRRALTHILVFSGTDLWRQGAFAHDGLLWTPAGAGRDGIVLKAIGSTGSYRYRSGALGDVQVTGWTAGAAVMPGLHFTRHGVSVAAYAGVEMQWHRLSPFDPGNDLQGRHVGVRAAIDLWAEPTPQSMVAASVTLTTIGGAYAARVAAGWRVFDRFYLGPEAIAYGGPDHRQLRIGAHVTALQTRLFAWRFEWQGGLGFAVDDDDNRGAYARLGVLWRH